jgi:hypothetical protein
MQRVARRELNIELRDRSLGFGVASALGKTRIFKHAILTARKYEYFVSMKKRFRLFLGYVGHSILRIALTVAFGLAVPPVARANLSGFMPDFGTETVGPWGAAESGGVISAGWYPGRRQFNFALPINGSHFELQFTSIGWSEAGTFNLTLSFDGGPFFLFVGQADSSGTITARLPDDDVAAWTHNLTAGHTLTIQGLPDGAWTIPLKGTTLAISDMANAISFMGIRGLPAPFNTPMYNIMGRPLPDLNDAGDLLGPQYRNPEFILDIIDESTSVGDGGPWFRGTPSGELEEELPQFVSPLNPQTFAFNQAIRKAVETQLEWYRTHRDGPDDGFALIASVGVLNGYGGNETWNELSSNVVSAHFIRTFRSSGSQAVAYHEFGFNWVLGKQRLLVPNDIFDPTKNWQQAVVNFTHNTWQGQKVPDSVILKALEDTSRWELDHGEIFFQFTDDASNTIPWAILKPYLNKAGLVHALDKNGFAQ